MTKAKKSALGSIWNDPVWSKVIAAVIVAGGTEYLFHWWARLTRIVSAFVDFVFTYRLFPVWLLIGLALFALPSAVWVIAKIWRIAKPKQNLDAKPHWSTYTEDVFFGLKWSWSYSGTSIKNLYSLCSPCNYQVYGSQDYGRAFGSSAYSFGKIKFHCDLCGKDYPVDEPSEDSLKDKVERQIQRKLRTDTWHKSAQRM